MAIGVAVGIFTKPEYTIPEIWNNFGSMHPSGTPVWSFMFITVACGAISGFHATQSPPDGSLHEEREAGPLRLLRRDGLRGVLSL